VRNGLANLRHDARQQIRSDGGDEPHFQFPGERIGVAARQRDDFVALIQHAARANHDLPAHLGKLYVLRLSLHQFDAEIFLELLQLSGQSRLADERSLRRLAEMTGVGQRHQIFEVLEIHRSLPIDAVYQSHHNNQYD